MMPDGSGRTVVDVDGWPQREGVTLEDGQELIQLDETTAVIRSKKGGRIGQTVYVPMQTAWMEYDGRIIKV